MMGMMGAMMGFMLLGTLFFIVVLVVAIWLLVSFLNKRQTPPMPYTPNPYQRYEQGYQPPQPLSETYQEGGRHDRYPQPKQEFDQPYVPYPQEQEMPPQS
jgi:predicted lipid-binding transport protein (Tim44 family)